MSWVVELEPGVWLAPWSGDPGRTLVRKNAEVFSTEDGARGALEKARGYRLFRHGKVVER